MIDCYMFVGLGALIVGCGGAFIVYCGKVLDEEEAEVLRRALEGRPIGVDGRKIFPPAPVQEGRAGATA